MSVPKIIQDIRSLYSQSSLLNQKVNTINKYNLMTAAKTAGAPQVVTVSPLPRAGWTVSGNTSTSGQYSLLATSTSGSNYVHNVISDSTSSTWLSTNGWNHSITIQLPSIMKVTKLLVNASFPNGGSSIYIDARASTTASWTRVYITTTTEMLYNNTITLPSNVGSYLQYRIEFALENSGAARVSRLDISSYEIVNLSNYAYTASNVNTTFSANDRLLVRTPNVDIVGITTNTVNSISLDTILKPNTDYELVYRSNKFYTKEIS